MGTLELNLFKCTHILPRPLKPVKRPPRGERHFVQISQIAPEFWVAPCRAGKICGSPLESSIAGAVFSGAERRYAWPEDLDADRNHEALEVLVAQIVVVDAHAVRPRRMTIISAKRILSRAGPAVIS
jgi:hypothetical protein